MHQLLILDMLLDGRRTIAEVAREVVVLLVNQLVGGNLTLLIDQVVGGNLTLLRHALLALRQTDQLHALLERDNLALQASQQTVHWPIKSLQLVDQVKLLVRPNQPNMLG